jgi:MoaA/NifB/PqqE/SkfB family radical SAM enzyme
MESFASQTKFEIGKTEILCGWVCNNNCVFCSVGRELSMNRKVKSFDEIKKDIISAKKDKSKGISFSGGEPTILPYLVDAIKLAKDLGFKKIEVQTNGRMFYYKDFTEKVIDAGMNKILFSIHGHNAKLHDSLTRIPGSFKQAVQGIKNVLDFREENDMDIRTSTVLVKSNYKLMPDIMDFLLAFDLDAYHISHVILDGYALMNRKVIYPKLSETAPYVHKAIEKAWAKGKDVWTYSFPFCLMQGYERAVAELGGDDTILKGPDFTVSIQSNRRKFRTKRKECSQCKYNNFCLGIWKRYAKFYGLKELKHVEGEMITDKSFISDQTIGHE